MQKLYIKNRSPVKNIAKKDFKRKTKENYLIVNKHYSKLNYPNFIMILPAITLKKFNFLKENNIISIIYQNKDKDKMTQYFDQKHLICKARIESVVYKPISEINFKLLRYSEATNGFMLKNFADFLEIHKITDKNTEFGIFTFKKIEKIENGDN